MIDLTLDSLTVPGIPDYTPPFGTQKDPLVSLSTVETQNNIIKPFTAQRAVEFSHDETLSHIERNAVLVFTGDVDAVLDMSDVTTFKGNEIKIVNTTSHALTVKYLEAGEVSYSTMNLTENSVTLTADSTTTYSVKVSVESESITTLWTGTKEQFDAIPVKDSNTLYNIIDDVDEELIQDDKISPNSTWSSEKIEKEVRHNWLSGKIINFLGDSITEGMLTGHSDIMERPYPSVVASLLNCTCNNYGKSGSSLVDSSAAYSYESFIDRMTTMNKQADMNVVMGGINDFSHSQILLGNKSDSGTSTIYGALNTIAEYLIENFPNAINVFCSPTRIISQNNGRYAMEELVYAVKSVAKKYGFVFIDTYHCLPMWMPQNSKLVERYGVNGVNTTHPNQLFSDTVFGKYMAQALLTLDSGAIVNPKDPPFVRTILDLANYYNGEWFDGIIKGYVDEGVGKFYFQGVRKLKTGGGLPFTGSGQGWNEAEYKVASNLADRISDWHPMFDLGGEIICFVFCGSGANEWTWSAGSVVRTYPSSISYGTAEVPLDR